MRHLVLDIETWSSVPIALGAARYCAADDFIIYCAATLGFDDSPKPGHRHWPEGVSRTASTPAEVGKLLNAVKDAVGNGARLYCWNIAFELTALQRVIDWNPHESMIADPMASAAYLNLPRSLDNCASYLLGENKDESGKKMMMQVVRQKTQEDALRKFRANRNDIVRYCAKDVELTWRLATMLGDLPEFERRVWEADLVANLEGFPVRTGLAAAATKTFDSNQRKLTKTMQSLTGGTVDSPSKRAALKTWLEDEHKIVLEDTTAESTDRLLAGKLPKAARSAIETMREATRTMNKKWQFADDANVDGRLHGTVAYSDAITGRWTGRGIQPQNFPRMSEPKNPEDLANAIADGRVDNSTLQKSLRMVVKPEPGQMLMTSDFSGIELCVSLWAVGDERQVAMIEDGKDLYVDMASRVFKIDYDNVNADQRFIGKQLVLGLGYMMGAPTFHERLKTYGIVEPLHRVEQWVKIYRRVNKPICNAWGQLSEAWLAALDYDVELQLNDNGITIEYETRFLDGCDKPLLHCKLPTGRDIVYPNIHAGRTRFGKTTFYDKIFAGKPYVNERVHGGTLLENIVQAIARDIMAAAIVRASEDPDINYYFQVHDEIVCSVPAEMTISEFEDRVMLVKCGGIPIRCETLRSMFWAKP